MVDIQRHRQCSSMRGNSRRFGNRNGDAMSSSWATTSSTVALTCHRRTFSRSQRSEIFEDTTSSCATAVFAFSEGEHPSLWDLPSRGINSRWKWSTLSRLTLSGDCWIQHGSPSSLPWLPCSFNSYFTWFEAPNSAVVFDQYIWFDLSRFKE